MSSRSQAWAFVREARAHGKVWALRNADPFAKLRGDDAKRAIPFWSNKARFDEVLESRAVGPSPEPLEVPLEDLENGYLPSLEEDGLFVGLNWGRHAEGLAVNPLVLLNLFDERGMENMQIREGHYRAHFGEMADEVMHSTDDKTPHIDIYQFPPNEAREHWVLITGGMSALRQPPLADSSRDIRPRAEIMMYVAHPKGWMFSVLKGLAEMPFDDDTFLHWGHTVPNGKPMTAEPSKLTSFLFLPPLFEDETLHDLVIDGDGVDVLWLVPITEREREYAVNHGSQALREAFSNNGLSPVVDERRSSLV